MSLTLAPGLTLPDDFATQGTAIIGVRGSGKSNTEVRFAELLHGVGIPFVAVDPKGDWHGIRMAGTGPGLPIPVFGGLYGDFPLDEHLGARIADLLVNENLSAVLDVSRLSKAALSRFLVAFCTSLMDRHQREPHVRTVILEEAHRYIPQVVSGKPAADLKEATASLLLEGRAFGLGCWACTQRPARLHNDVLEEVDTAIIHRIGVTASADLDRVRKWVKHEDLGDEIGESLTKLKAGEAWVLSPVALGVVQRVQIDRRTTADTGATPLVGEAKRRTVSTMADIDAPAITEALSDAIEKAKAIDPKALQARVAELTAENNRLVDRVDAEYLRAERATERAEIPVEIPTFPGAELTAHALEAGTDALRLMDEGLEAMNGTRAALSFALKQLEQEASLRAASAAATNATRPVRSTAPRRPTPATVTPISRPKVSAVVSTNGDSPVDIGDGAPSKVVAALARHHEGLRRAQLPAIAGVKARASTLRNALSRLRRLGLIVEDGDMVRLTDAGFAAAGGVQGLPSGPALLDYWRDELGEGTPRLVFDHLVKVHGMVDRQDLADTLGVDPTVSTLRNALSKLRIRGLIYEDNGELSLDPDLREAAR